MANKKKAQSSRLFENKYLEAGTHVHPITPLLLWTPIIACVLWESSKNLSLLEHLPWVFAGLLVWTLSEYLVHRIAFHYEAKGRVGKYLVFLFHGIHHDEPDDATRLVMPPIPALLFAGLFYLLFSAVVGPVYAKPLFAFFMIGYLCYDYIHYAIHHFACRSKVMKFIKRHHMLHHHLVHEGNFGVSSPLWDYVFRTFQDKASREQVLNSKKPVSQSGLA